MFSFYFIFVSNYTNFDSEIGGQMGANAFCWRGHCPPCSPVTPAQKLKGV